MLALSFASAKDMGRGRACDSRVQAKSPGGHQHRGRSVVRPTNLRPSPTLVSPRANPRCGSRRPILPGPVDRDGRPGLGCCIDRPGLWRLIGALDGDRERRDAIIIDVDLALKGSLFLRAHKTRRRGECNPAVYRPNGAATLPSAWRSKRQPLRRR